MEHKGKIIFKEEILANRCSKYEFLNFNKKTIQIENIMKNKLAQVLREEFERLKNHSNFNIIEQQKEYDLAIEYLETGKHPSYYYDNDLLYACIEDFEQMCVDYGVN